MWSGIEKVVLSSGSRSILPEIVEALRTVDLLNGLKLWSCRLVRWYVIGSAAVNLPGNVLGAKTTLENQCSAEPDNFVICFTGDVES